MTDSDTNPATQHLRDFYRGRGRGDIEVHTGTFGTYVMHVGDPSIDHVIVGEVEANHVPDLLTETRQVLGDGPSRIYIDDRALDAKLQPVLMESGCSRSCELHYLSHCGEIPEVIPIPSLEVRDAQSRTDLETYVRTRIQAFSDSELPPNHPDVQDEVELVARSRGRCGHQIGWIGDDAAAVIGWEEGANRVIFHLATRVPFRRRGIARNLLSRLIKASISRPHHQSLTIFTDPSDGPIPFYRSIGFVDEAYWQVRYSSPING